MMRMRRKNIENNYLAMGSLASTMPSDSEGRGFADDASVFAANSSLKWGMWNINVIQGKD